MYVCMYVCSHATKGEDLKKKERERERESTWKPSSLLMAPYRLVQEGVFCCMGQAHLTCWVKHT